ncbi:MAG: hypothetical protein II964_00705 [Synergistaceae bacterium]|nr:hypothetical protein [Synergistaceae bacterium]
MGSGGSTTQYRKRDPEPQGLIDIRQGIYDKLMPGLQSFTYNDWNTARDTASSVLNAQKSLLSQVSPQLTQGNALADEIASIARTGNIPSTVTDNLNASVNKNLQSGIGSMINGLGARGVVNSSITSQALNNLSQQAADAYNSNYLNAYNATINGLGSALQGQQANTAALAQGIYALGKIPEQAYGGATAALTPAIDFWKAWQNSYDSREDYDTVVKQGK